MHLRFFLVALAQLAAKLEGGAESRSERARQVVLRDENTLYLVSAVNVQLHEGQKFHKATFHAEAADDNEHRDLDFEIPQSLYDALVQYTKQGDPDLVFLLSHQNNSFSWCLLSESWLRQFTNAAGVNQYVV